MKQKVVNKQAWEDYTTLWNDFAEVFPALVKNECDEKAKQLTRQLKIAFDKIFEYAEDETEDLDTDKVNHPSHYMSYYKDGIECIDAMKSAFGEATVAHFCIGNAFKYIWRHSSKNGMEDIDKAIWYLNKYKELNHIEMGG